MSYALIKCFYVCVRAPVDVQVCAYMSIFVWACMCVVLYASQKREIVCVACKLRVSRLCIACMHVLQSIRQSVQL